MDLGEVRALARRVTQNVHQVIVGKTDVIEFLLIALIAGGHVLLEDVPGTGKTKLARAFAKSLSCTYRRMQFTPDLLPSDLTGIYFFNQQQSAFEFRPGPVFTQVLLADEINRATPRTQASLLECMEERQVTIEGQTHALTPPFFVIATQNPVESQGTFPLPEAQLDRFLLRLSMRYPSTDESLQMMRRYQQSDAMESLSAVATADEIVAAQKTFTQVKIHDDVLEYLQAVVERTRVADDILLGVSPRGSLALLRACQVHAIMRDRDFVTPDDIHSMAIPVLAHRILLRRTGRVRQVDAESAVRKCLEAVPVPTERI